MKASLKTTLAAVMATTGLSGAVQAAPAGSELDLGLTPVAGGMEGIGVARPRGNLGLVVGNPASITQLEGETSFTVGGSWISPDLKSEGTFSVPGPGGTLGGAPLDGRSDLDDLAMPHVAVAQRITDRLVVGMGVTGSSGLGSDFRDSFPTALSLTADLKLFGATMTAGYQVTDKLAVGAGFTLGIGSLQVGTIPSTSSSNNFGVGGRAGFTYDAGPLIFGASYKTEIKIKYSKVVLVNPNTLSDFTLTQPREFRAGVSTSESFSDKLMLSVEGSWKNYSNAAGYKDFWRNQWRIALGGQFDVNDTWSLRAGWSYSRAISKPAEKLGNSLGEITSLFAPGFPDLGLGPETAPVFPDIIQLTQSTIANGLWQQGISGGLGVQLTDRIRVDVNASYGFDGKQEFTSPIPGSLQSLSGDGSIFSTGMGISWAF